MPGFIDGQSGLAKTGEPFYFWVPATANKRIYWGPVEFFGFRVNAQTGSGTIRVFDGLDNTGTLIWHEASPTVAPGTVVGPKNPIYCRYGIYIELNGTGQNVDVLVGD